VFDVFNDSFRPFFRHPFFNVRDEVFNSSNLTPKSRITEDKENYCINIEMPGITKDDVKISLENNVLSVSGTKKKETKSEDTNLIMNEIYYGEFARSFNLTDEIKKEDIDAEFKNGILNIVLPKVEEAKSLVKEIKVK
jgi:HSP20 family protein